LIFHWSKIGRRGIEARHRELRNSFLTWTRRLQRGERETIIGPKELERSPSSFPLINVKNQPDQNDPTSHSSPSNSSYAGDLCRRSRSRSHHLPQQADQSVVNSDLRSTLRLPSSPLGLVKQHAEQLEQPSPIQACSDSSRSDCKTVPSTSDQRFQPATLLRATVTQQLRATVIFRVAQLLRNSHLT
jgi:hypothetical protein